jgi:hypothetical protein
LRSTVTRRDKYVSRQDRSWAQKLDAPSSETARHIAYQRGALYGRNSRLALPALLCRNHSYTVRRMLGPPVDPGPLRPMPRRLGRLAALVVAGALPLGRGWCSAASAQCITDNQRPSRRSSHVGRTVFCELSPLKKLASGCCRQGARRRELEGPGMCRLRFVPARVARVFGRYGVRSGTAALSGSSSRRLAFGRADPRCR